ncbi:class I SAM-dependent methyltransferase [Curtobacterium sp. VKM Ac-2922]|uniref:class I SAM-dependent methyltransferase n=1 Tax=Curtobacterium sp. VKM Ac-2922 TaxID=2929475 RepID=UPI0027E33FDC|nr:class I SAM-dependent methyltransferase [Curtobacterium sp. VKM Ac-2922]
MVRHDVVRRYTERAAEYAQRLGTIAHLHPADEHLVTSWAASQHGRVLDAGCGPGHWAAHLVACGHDAVGIDAVPAFVDHARRAYPGLQFDVGDLGALTAPDDAFAGVLAWYSLIHHEPAALPAVLAEFARVLEPGGGLLVGFFTGAAVEPFDHAVTTAWRWSPAALAAVLDTAGFEVLETHTRSVPGDRPRPHGAIVARLRS